MATATDVQQRMIGRARARASRATASVGPTVQHAPAGLPRQNSQRGPMSLRGDDVISDRHRMPRHARRSHITCPRNTDAMSTRWHLQEAIDSGQQVLPPRGHVLERRSNARALRFQIEFHVGAAAAQAHQYALAAYADR
jgi:hypothetical protein